MDPGFPAIGFPCDRSRKAVYRLAALRWRADAAVARRALVAAIDPVATHAGGGYVGGFSGRKVSARVAGSCDDRAHWRGILALPGISRTALLYAFDRRQSCRSPRELSSGCDCRRC